MHTIYESAGGSDGLLKLAAAWHARVLDDEVVGHAFSRGFHPRHTERLAAYWIEALGGPAEYSEQFSGDESSVVRMHSGNGVHTEMDERAIACFDRAMDDAGINDDRLRSALHDYFAWTTTKTMARYHRSAEDVPDGMAILKWTWQGPVTAETEAIRNAYDALNRNDVDGFIESFDPEIVRIEPDDFPSAGTYRGRDAVREHIVKGRSTWAEGGCFPERFIVVGDKVVVPLHVHVRLKERTDWIDAHIADGFTFRDGKAVEFNSFSDERQALEWTGAAELSANGKV